LPRPVQSCMDVAGRRSRCAAIATWQFAFVSDSCLCAVMCLPSGVDIGAAGDAFSAACCSPPSAGSGELWRTACLASACSGAARQLSQHTQHSTPQSCM
jgi:hypothetical protein